MSILQERDTLREVIAEALGIQTSTAKKPVESFNELSQLIAAAGGQVHS